MSTRPPAISPASSTTRHPSAPKLAPPRRVDSTALMDGERVLEIVHLGVVYRLQTTRFGKLILTK